MRAENAKRALRNPLLMAHTPNDDPIPVEGRVIFVRHSNFKKEIRERERPLGN